MTTVLQCNKIDRKRIWIFAVSGEDYAMQRFENPQQIISNGQTIPG